MKGSKYCECCGCYIPDLWNSCPACGYMITNVIVTRQCNDVEDVAEFILNAYHDAGNYYITNYRLNMILYFIQAEFMVSRNRPCFQDEIIAKQFGPIVQRIFDRYCMYAASPIQTIRYKNNIHLIDEGLIKGIINECDKYSTSDLATAIHKQRPYIDAINSESKIITNESLRIFFGN